MKEEMKLGPMGKDGSEPLEKNNRLGEHGAKEQENGDSLRQDMPEDLEAAVHLLPEQGVDLNRPQHCEEIDDPGTNASKRHTAKKRWKELNRIVFWKIRLWMVLVLIFLFIFLVIVFSLVLSSVGHDDEDEKFDRASFVVPRLYTGTFRLVNQNFTADLLEQPSQRRELSAQLTKKLYDIYASSPALGRFFNSVNVTGFSNSSETASFWLKFLMPRDHRQLLQYTLSRSMVYNVLWQSLCDQAVEPNDPLFIDLASLRVEVGNTKMNGESDHLMS